VKFTQDEKETQKIEKDLKI